MLGRCLCYLSNIVNWFNNQHCKNQEFIMHSNGLKKFVVKIWGAQTHLCFKRITKILMKVNCCKRTYLYKCCQNIEERKYEDPWTIGWRRKELYPSLYDEKCLLPFMTFKHKHNTHTQTRLVICLCSIMSGIVCSTPSSCNIRQHNHHVCFDVKWCYGNLKVHILQMLHFYQNYYAMMQYFFNVFKYFLRFYFTFCFQYIIICFWSNC